MLTIYKPNYQDLWFKQLMMSDQETMSYNHAYGGTIPFPKDRWQEWYDRWILSDDRKKYYRYLKNNESEFVGEISYRYDEAESRYFVDLVIYSKYRRRGYGSQALNMLCSIAKENGIEELYDEIAIDNPSVELFLKHGFKEEYRTDQTVLLRKNTTGKKEKRSLQQPIIQA